MRKERRLSAVPLDDQSPTRDDDWDQIYPSHARPGSLRIPLQELHDPASGRLDASRLADYLKVPLKQLAEALGKSYSALHKTPAAPDVQPFLQSVKMSLVILEDVLRDRSAVLAWLNHPHADLGQRTPLDVILQGHPNAVKNMLQAAVMGTPS
ncbi:MAG TPA: antitoxin Xre/MbcA/ParS toxin-binding domain-containing protein [Thermoanaerobaculia bacterium]